MKILSRLLILAFLLPSLAFGESSLTASGNSIQYNVTDGFVQENPLSAFGDFRTIELSPLFQGTCEYTVDNTDLTTNTIVNGGTVTQALAMCITSTSTTTASTALFQSKQHAKYHAGFGFLWRGTALFTAPVADTEQLIGIMDEVGSSVAFKNGFAIGYIGTTYGFHIFKNDTIETITLANWDDPLDGFGPSGDTIAQTNIEVYYIGGQYLGAGAITVWRENTRTGVIQKVYTHLYSGLNTDPSVHNPNFHHTMWVNNKTTTSNLIVKGASYAFFIEGKTEFTELQRPIHSTGIKQKTGVTSEVAILTIRNKATYASKTNFIDVHIEAAFMATEATNANNISTCRIVKNATLGGTPSYSDINTTNSVIEVDTSGTTVSNGDPLFPFQLAGKNDKENKVMTGHKVILNPNDTLTIACLSGAGSATFNAGLSWKDLF